MEQSISGSGHFSGSNITQVFRAQPFLSIVSYLLEHFLIDTEFLSDVAKYIFFSVRPHLRVPLYAAATNKPGIPG